MVFVSMVLHSGVEVDWPFRVHLVHNDHALHLTKLLPTFLCKELLLLLQRKLGNCIEIVLDVLHKILAEVVVAEAASRPNHLAAKALDGLLNCLRRSGHC